MNSLSESSMQSAEEKPDKLESIVLGHHTGKGNSTSHSPDHEDATARVCIDGLSILCFNPETNAAEIVFVKKHHTPPTITVYDKDCKFLWSYTCPSDPPETIDIKTSNTGGKGRCYRELLIKNDEDFSYMPDFCKWHDVDEVEFKDTAKDGLSAKLRLYDATFYTRVRSGNQATRRNTTDDDTKPSGRIGKVLGANITCDGNNAAIDIYVNGVHIKSFDKNDGPFNIIVKTTPHNHEDADPDHLKIIYEDILNLSPRYSVRYNGYEGPWLMCGFVAQEEVETAEQGRKRGEEWPEGIVRIKATEYLCQTIGGGDGTPPDLPPIDPIK
jgi:hypothetical protein